MTPPQLKCSPNLPAAPSLPMVGDTLNRRAKTHNFNPGFSQQQFNKLKERHSKLEEMD